MKIKCFLYGYYNSRGGSVLIVSESRQIADQRYLYRFFEGDQQFWHTARENYLCEANLECEKEPEDGTDIKDLALIKTSYPNKGKESYIHKDEMPAEILLTKQFKAGYRNAKWDNGAFGLIYIKERK